LIFAYRNLSLNPLVQPQLFFWPQRSSQPLEESLLLGNRRLRIFLVRNHRARRYILRLRRDGAARVTIPRGGSRIEAKRFAAKHAAWLEEQLLRQAKLRTPSSPWRIGTPVLLRGQPIPLEPSINGQTGKVRFGAEFVTIPRGAADLRPAIERHLWLLAARELPARVSELAALHQFHFQRVTVRNQRSRWGSCSKRGTISLNWRLIQAPPFVCDYIILHELAHLKEMNHSARFWREVARLCPDFQIAERWLKQHRVW